MWTRVLWLVSICVTGAYQSDGVGTPSQCMLERRQALVSNSGTRVRSPGVYVPECLDDGSFSPVQCHQAAGYCWCVTHDGRPIPETSVQGTDAQCKERSLRAAKNCDHGDRTEFNKNLVAIFSEEYHRDPNVADDVTHNANAVIGWKFGQLDENKDGVLPRVDIRTLKVMLKKVVKPRKCAKTFDSYCDLNGDKRLSREEWLWCLGGDVTRIKSPPGEGKACTPGNRARFNLQLVQAFLKEFDEGPGASVTAPDQWAQDQDSQLSLVDGRKRQAIAFKFAQLDRDRDGRLRREEIRNFKKQVKSGMRPKSCAKSLDLHCDLNHDKFITSNEWTYCLGIDMDNAPPGGSSRFPERGLSGGHVGSHNSPLEILTSGPKGSVKGDGELVEIVSDQESRQTTTPHEEESILDSGCTKARSHFLREHRADPGAHIFVPVCVEDGSYRKEQCHNATGYCWCVDGKSGRPIPTTSTRNVMPNCTNVKIREFKGCSYPMRRVFLTKLLDQLTTEMMDFAHNASDKSPVLDTDPDMSLEEAAVRWKLRMLDGNNNENLERKELKEFKKVVRMKKDLRKCSRNFLRYCDEDKDGGVSLVEWVDCTGINEKQRNLPDIGHSKGSNPFIAYLNADSQ